MKIFFHLLLFLLLTLLSGGKCVPSSVIVPCPTHGSKHYNSWTPHWWYTSEHHQSSNIEVVQGLPGYTPIAGKNMLIAFSPDYACDTVGRDKSAWLDIFRLYPNGTVSSLAVGITGTLAPEGIQVNHNNNYPVETNFFVDGSMINSPGQYLFVVRSKCCSDNRPIRDSLIASFCAPSQVKVLYVPLGKDIYNIPDLRKSAFESINLYLSRFPYPSSAYNSPSPNSRYWDIYDGYIPYKDSWLAPGYLDLMNNTTLYEIKTELQKIKDAYNSTAPQKADYVSGIYERSSGWVYADGITSFPFTVCNISDLGNLPHEMGHLFDKSPESADQYAQQTTCGFFSKEAEDGRGCSDWGFDPYTKEIISQPTNMISWRGSTKSGFFTRLYYELACITCKGGCTSPILEGALFSIKTLDDMHYISADPATGKVETKSAREIDNNTPLWRVGSVTPDPGGKTWYLELWWAGINGSGSTNTVQMLICNPQTGEFKLVDSDYYSAHCSNELRDWKHGVEFKHIAMGVHTFEFNNYPKRSGFMGWKEPHAHSSDYDLYYYEESSDIDYQYYTPFVQWKIATLPYTSR